MSKIILLDEDIEFGRQSYGLTRVVKVGPNVVRVRVKRDSYEFQSYAVVELLSETREWTELAQSSAASWHRTTSPGRSASQVDPRDQLGDLADRLVSRAATILG